MAISIDKAIKILTRGSPESDKATFTEYAEARDLGVEALKREKEYRLTRGNRTFDLLPGETEE